MEPKPRRLDRETGEPLTIELSQQHLDNLQKQIKQPLRDRKENASFADARYNRRSFSGAIAWLKSGRSINIKLVNIGNDWNIAVGILLGDEFYYAFMAGLFGQDENGISGEEFGKIDAEVKEKRVVVLKLKMENSKPINIPRDSSPLT